MTDYPLNAFISTVPNHCAVCGDHWVHITCECRETLHMRPLGEGKYAMQHGPNPEHRSPEYSGSSERSHAWRKSVHERMR